MGITEDGIIGEQLLFQWLRNKNIKFFQLDAISFYKSKYYGYEVKHQERFLPPPFEGHGLPIWQVKARLKFQQETGIRILLVIFEKNTTNVFYQFLDVLENGEFIDTHGKHPRRIYDLKLFLLEKNYEEPN